MKLLQSILSAAELAMIPIVPHTTTSAPAFPSSHPASVQFVAWLSAFNTVDRETLLAYHTDSSLPLSVLKGPLQSPFHNVDQELSFAKMTGGFNVAKVESCDDPSYVVVVMQEKEPKNRPRIFRQHIRANMSVDTSRPTYPATKLMFEPIVTPLDLIPLDDPRRPDYENAMAPLTAERRRAVIDGIIDELRENYVDPSVGEEAIATIEECLKNGTYDTFDNNEKFSYRLSHDLRSHAKHLFVAFFEPRPEFNQSAYEAELITRLEDLRGMNFGFGNTTFDTESVPGRKIAILPISFFVPLKLWDSDTGEVIDALANIISDVADADALMVDLRANHGGDPNTVAFVESYLLDNGPLHTLDMVYRNGSVAKSHYTLPIDKLPAGSKRFGGDKPLFVLTNSVTMGGAEDLAYSLRAFKRTEAIIGEGSEVTLGLAQHLARPRFVAEEIFGKGWWMVGVPQIKPVHAITGSNWEGAGVKSDVVAGKGEWAEEEDAQKVAIKLAIRALQPNKEL